MSKLKCQAVISSQKELCQGIFDLRLNVPEIAGQAKAGQFVNVFLNDAGRILPRPISICSVEEDGKVLRLVYRVTGEKTGTKELSGYPAGTEINILGPLGNGFPLDTKDTAVIGGGIGIPPLLELLHELSGKKTAVLGYRDSKTFLKDDFDKAADNVLIASEDGSTGTRGNVIDAMNAAGYVPSCIMACGPAPMLRALKKYSAEHGIECWVSMEERMACGVGVCLGCVVKSTEIDPHSHVRNKRVCKDGPVFKAEEVEI